MQNVAGKKVFVDMIFILRLTNTICIETISETDLFVVSDYLEELQYTYHLYISSADANDKKSVYEIRACAKGFESLYGDKCPKNRGEIKREVCKKNYIETNYKLIEISAIQQTTGKNTSDNFITFILQFVSAGFSEQL
jgi:hypothetical protein